MRECLPRREVGDVLGADQLADLLFEFLGLTDCGGDGQHRALRRQGMGQKRSQRLGAPHRLLGDPVLQIRKD